MKDLVIIGSGPTGLYAAYLAGLKKLNAVIIESADNYGGQLNYIYPNKLIYDLPGFNQITAKDYVDLLYNQYLVYENEIKMYLDQKVINIIKEKNYYIIKTSKMTIKTKTVLISHGGGAYEPRKINYNFNNISYIMKDIVKIKDKDVVILGGGDSAIDYALMIQDYVKSLKIVHRRNEFRANPSSVDLLNENVLIYKPYDITNITNNKVYINNKIDSYNISYDELFVFYGSVRGKSQLTINEDIINESILVNSKMLTKYENIFAAGNSCTYDGKLTVIVTALGEVTTAIGAIADLLYPMRNNHEYSSLRKSVLK